MKLTITSKMWHGTRAVSARATIGQSKKLGVPHQLQKTWTIPTVAPQFAIEELRPSFEADAKRWEAKQMAKIAKQKELHEAVEKSKEQLTTPRTPEEWAEIKAKMKEQLTPPPTPASVPAP